MDKDCTCPCSSKALVKEIHVTDKAGAQTALTLSEGILASAYIRIRTRLIHLIPSSCSILLYIMGEKKKKKVDFQQEQETICLFFFFWGGKKKKLGPTLGASCCSVGAVLQDITSTDATEAPCSHVIALKEAFPCLSSVCSNLSSYLLHLM